MAQSRTQRPLTYRWYKGLIHELQRYTRVGGAAAKGANVEGLSLIHQIDGSQVLTW